MTTTDVDEASFEDLSSATDDEVLAAAREMMPQPKQRRKSSGSALGDVLTDGPGPSWIPGWWPLAAAAVVLLVLGVGLGRVSGSSAAAAGAASPPELADAVPVQMLGQIDGVNTDAGLYAWPGQPLTAPEPQMGKAVAHQWETCVGDDCEPVDGATKERWASPPVNSNTLVRVVVDVKMANGEVIPFASPTVTANAFPDGYKPGDDPIATTTTTEEPTTTTGKSEKSDKKGK